MWTKPKTHQPWNCDDIAGMSIGVFKRYLHTRDFCSTIISYVHMMIKQVEEGLSGNIMSLNSGRLHLASQISWSWHQDSNCSGAQPKLRKPLVDHNDLAALYIGLYNVCVSGSGYKERQPCLSILLLAHFGCAVCAGKANQVIGQGDIPAWLQCLQRLWQQTACEWMNRNQGH